MYSKVIQLYTYIFFELFSTIGYYEVLNIVLVLHSKSLLLVCFKYSSLYLLILYS